MILEDSMSKKQKVLEAEVTEEGLKAEDNNAINNAVAGNKTETKKTKEKDKSKDKEKNKKKDKKDKKDKKSFGRKIKETTSELKKVTWPTFGEVCKKTGIVIAFVLIAGVFLYGVNYLLGGLVNLLINGTWV